MTQKITTFLTFDGTAEDAVKLYTSVFKNSRVISTQRYAADAPDRKKGEFMTAEIELDGQPFMVLNGGPSFSTSPSVSSARFRERSIRASSHARWLLSVRQRYSTASVPAYVSRK